jgi:hypothetical protein
MVFVEMDAFFAFLDCFSDFVGSDRPALPNTTGQFSLLNPPCR